MLSVRFRLFAGVLIAISLLTASLIASAQNNGEYQDFATDEFYEVWERTDRPVQEQIVDRTWMWGPGANTGLLQEPYEEADDGVRDVQYTDKSRMEMPWSEDADPDSPWFITQGLLATELMTGRVQVGDNSFIDAFPAQIRVAGDPDDVYGPTYETMGWFMDADPRSEGNVITDVVTVDGSQFSNPDLAIHNAIDEYWIQETGFYIASPFWAFMTSSGPIYENGILQQGQVVPSPFYAVGFPLTPAFWSWVKVDNVEQNVLIQCFERRCLTFAPDNPDGWEVESGNVGQHYYHWRYEQIGDIDDGVSDDDVSDDATDDGVDDADPPSEPVSFSVSPDSSVNLINTTHEITVTVLGDDNEPFESANVSASVTEGPHDGTDLSPAIATTDADGNASLSYTGSNVGTDTITVSVQGIDESQTVTKTWVDFAIELDPEDAVNVVGTSYLLTATLMDSDGAVELDDDDDFSVNVSREDDDGTSDLDDTDFDVVINTDGEIEVSYTGPTETAIDTITVAVMVDVNGVDEEISASTTKTWVADDPDTILLAHFEEELDADDFDPTETDVNTVGTDHTVYALALDQHGNPVQDGTEIDFVVTNAEGNSLVLAEGTTQTTDGIASFTYTGPTEPREDGITASWSDDVPPVPSSNMVIKEWVVGEPAFLTLDLWFDHPSEEQFETNELGDRHHVVAVVTDQFGNAVPNVSVTFSLSEDSQNYPVTDLSGDESYGVFNTDPDTGYQVEYDEVTGSTNQFGEIGFLYDGEVTGQDTIIATVTGSTNPDLSDTSEKLWITVEVIEFTEDELEDNWGVNRGDPSFLESVSFDGRDNVVHFGVDSLNAPTSEFNRTRGIWNDRRGEDPDFGTVVEIDLYLDPEWEDRAVRAGLWTSGCDSAGARTNEWAILEFTTATPVGEGDIDKDERWRAWLSGNDWTDLGGVSFVYGQWYTLRIELDPVANEYHFSIDGASVLTLDANPATESLCEVLLHGYAYGQEDFVDDDFLQNYSLRWHNLRVNIAE